MDYNFLGKVVLITGGTGKLGKCLVKSFADCGAIVIFTSRNLKRAKKTHNVNENIFPFKCNLEKIKDIEILSKFITKKFKRIDIIINNAAVDIDQTFLNTTDHQIKSLLGTNLLGPYYICKNLIKMMIKQNNGKIINISSVLSKRTVPNAMEYSMSKAALDSLSRSIAVEFGKYNIYANSVNIGVMPGMLNKVDEVVKERSLDELSYKDWSVEKDRVPLRRRGKYNEYIQTVLFLSSDGSNFINGASIPVDGGILARL